MNLLKGTGFVALLFLSSLAMAADEAAPCGYATLQCHRFHYEGAPGGIDVRYGVQEPKGKPIGDVLYIHGFSDRLDNHKPLFDEWSKAGLRIISFDLPGHGENRGEANNINRWSFDEMAKLASAVEKRTRSSDPARPLVLSGWSTGGLLAIRMAQGEGITKLERKPKAMVLIAPGASVRWFPGEFLHVTQASLTANPCPPHFADPMPSQLITPFHFDLRLKLQSKEAHENTIPGDIPSLVLIGGDHADRYAKSSGLVSWVKEQNARGAKLIGIQCAEGKHELDNEAEPVGKEVRALAAQFAVGAANGKIEEPSRTSQCGTLIQ